MIDGHVVWWLVLLECIPGAALGWVLGRRTYRKWPIQRWPIPWIWLPVVVILWFGAIVYAVWWETYG